MRGLDIRAVKADVFLAEVVRHNVDDMGTWSALRGHGREHSPTAAGQHREDERKRISHGRHRAIPFEEDDAGHSTTIALTTSDKPGPSVSVPEARHYCINNDDI